MAKYVALLRGIGPGNPNMHSAKLKWFFESLDFKNVKTVISSGNVMFESPLKNSKKLEAIIEKALPKKLGFKSTTIIRSKEQLQHFVDKKPFKKTEHSSHTNLNVTFLKRDKDVNIKFPHKVENREYIILGKYDGAVCSIIDLTSSRTPDLMVWLEKQFGKEITTRTWKTVHRILNKFD